MNKEFDVSSNEFHRLVGRSRATVHRYRQSGLPWMRDPQTGRVFYRSVDVERIRQWQKNGTFTELFQ